MEQHDPEVVLDVEAMIEIVHNKTNSPRRALTAQIVKQVFKTVREAMGRDIPIKLRGIGTIRTFRRKSYRTWNPVVRRHITIPECKWIRLIPTTHMKHLVNGRAKLPRFMRGSAKQPKR